MKAIEVIAIVMSHLVSKRKPVQKQTKKVKITNLNKMLLI